MGISGIEHELITNKGIRGWDYEGGVAEAVRLSGGGDPIVSLVGGSLMNFGTYSTYYQTAFDVPIINITEPYQNATKLCFVKNANEDIGSIIARDELNNYIATAGTLGIAQGFVAHLCNNDNMDISNVGVSLGVYSYLMPGQDYQVMFSLATEITIDETPYNLYEYLCSPGNMNPWFYNALEEWTDGDRWDPEEEFDPDSEGGAPGGAGGGGAGGIGTGIRSHHGVGVPSVPSFSGATSGLMSVYACSPAELQSVAHTLWDNTGGTDWTDTLVKNYMSPFENIIGLTLLPFEPTQYITGTGANIVIGNFDTGVSSTKLSNTFAQIDLGSVNVPEAYKTYADYDNTSVDIYLPFIGVEQLNPDDIMDSTIHLYYNVDVLSGVCIAFIQSDRYGVFASYAGNMKCDLPISGVTFSNQAQAWACNNFGTGGKVGEIFRNSLRNQAMAEKDVKSPFDIRSRMLSVEYGLKGVDTTAPQYKRSGTIGSASALMGIKQPFLIFNTPRVWSGGVKSKKGFVSNLEVTIGSQSGFLSSSITNNQLGGINCTNEEKDEIRRLLSQGIYV